MDDILKFSGIAENLIISTAPVTRGTFSEKEGKKEKILEVEYSKSGEILKEVDEKSVKNYVYHEDNLLCIHVAKEDKTPLYKVDFYYEDSLLIRKTRINQDGIVDEDLSFFYDSEGNISQKKSKRMTYDYTYQNGQLIEERWNSEFSLSQIIRYRYDSDLLVEVSHFSGEDVPGRRVEYKYETHGFLTEEIVFSPSGAIISHIKFNYPTIYKDNWLKRVKYILHSQTRKKEAIEVTYRDFKFSENPPKEEEPIKPEIESEPESLQEEPPLEELVFDNGTYKGEILNGEMNGQGEFIFNTGTRYKGSFKCNRMEGKGQLTYITGKVYEGTFVNNVLEGPGACKWENGDFYAGEFKNGKMHGRGCYIWENGNRFEGLFEYNQRTDQGILYKASELESTAPPEWVNELFK